MKQILYTALLDNQDYQTLANEIKHQMATNAEVKVYERPKETLTEDDFPLWGCVLGLVLLLYGIAREPLKKVFVFILKVVFGIYLIKFLRK